MVALSTYDRSRCYHHCGFASGAGIPGGDIAALEEAMDRVRDHHHALVIDGLLAACDATWEDYLAGGTKRNSKELISGDINRSVQRSIDPFKAKAQAWEEYLANTDRLCQFFWVPNYWQESSLRYRFERAGGEHINLLPGIADTAVGASQYELTTSGGGFGISGF